MTTDNEVQLHSIKHTGEAPDLSELGEKLRANRARAEAYEQVLVLIRDGLPFPRVDLLTDEELAIDPDDLSTMRGIDR